MMFAAIVFGTALVLIALLFALKYREMRSGRVFAQPLRQRADRGALELKEALARTRIQASHVPPMLAFMTRVVVHEGALGFARLARGLERQAHSVADMVSHKHRFERKEPRSEFLKQMNEHKNGQPQDEVGEL